MKQRAFITMTLAVDLDMVPGTCHQPEDFVTFIEQALKGASHYDPEVSVQETVVKDYSWDDDKGYVRPEVFTMADRALVCEDLTAMLDRIHQIMDTQKEARQLIPLFDEIGCLIAKARGEYAA